MAVKKQHYFSNGVEYKGPTHKTAGKLMSGAKHTSASKTLSHVKKRK